MCHSSSEEEDLELDVKGSSTSCTKLPVYTFDNKHVALPNINASPHQILISFNAIQFQLLNIEFQDVLELLYHKFPNLLSHIALKPGSPQVMQSLQQQLVSSFVFDIHVLNP